MERRYVKKGGSLFIFPDKYQMLRISMNVCVEECFRQDAKVDMSRSEHSGTLSYVKAVSLGGVGDKPNVLL